MAIESDGSIERAVVLQRLDPDKRDAYVDAHDDVPQAVTDAMKRNDVVSFELFVLEDIAVCVLDAPDVNAYFADAMTDPEVQEWERHVARFKREGIDVDSDGDERVPLMEPLWSLEAGRINERENLV